MPSSIEGLGGETELIPVLVGVLALMWIECDAIDAHRVENPVGGALACCATRVSGIGKVTSSHRMVLRVILSSSFGDWA